jgi:hypothetical protein
LRNYFSTEAYLRDLKLGGDVSFEGSTARSTPSGTIENTGTSDTLQVCWNADITT